MFGKGKKKQEEEQEPEEVKIYQKPRQAPQVMQEEAEEAPEVKPARMGMAKIIEAVLLENGFRYVIVSNKKLGDIGQEFPID